MPTRTHTHTRQTPPARAEHLVAGSELRDVPANRFNLAGHIDAESCLLWFAQPRLHAQEVWRASHEVPVKWIDGRRGLLSRLGRPQGSACQFLRIQERRKTHIGGRRWLS